MKYGLWPQKNDHTDYGYGRLKGMRVFLDGQDVSRHCCQFNDEEGWCDLYRHKLIEGRDITASPRYAKDHPYYQDLPHGAVSIEVKERFIDRHFGAVELRKLAPHTKP